MVHIEAHAFLGLLFSLGKQFSVEIFFLDVKSGFGKQLEKSDPSIRFYA